jgi:hypothetical protein
MEHDHTLHGQRLATLLYFDHMNASLACTKSLYLFGSCCRSPQWCATAPAAQGVFSWTSPYRTAIKSRADP